MRVEVFHCDGCGAKLTGEDRLRERCFELRTPFSTREFDICRACWTKMTDVVPGIMNALREPAPPASEPSE